MAACICLLLNRDKRNRSLSGGFIQHWHPWSYSDLIPYGASGEWWAPSPPAPSGPLRPPLAARRLGHRAFAGSTLVINSHDTYILKPQAAGGRVRSEWVLEKPRKTVSREKAPAKHRQTWVRTLPPAMNKNSRNGRVVSFVEVKLSAGPKTRACLTVWSSPSNVYTTHNPSLTDCVNCGSSRRMHPGRLRDCKRCIVILSA